MKSVINANVIPKMHFTALPIEKGSVKISPTKFIKSPKKGVVSLELFVFK